MSLKRDDSIHSWYLLGKIRYIYRCIVKTAVKKTKPYNVMYFTRAKSSKDQNRFYLIIFENDYDNIVSGIRDWPDIKVRWKRLYRLDMNSPIKIDYDDCFIAFIKQKQFRVPLQTYSNLTFQITISDFRVCQLNLEYKKTIFFLNRNNNIQRFHH